MDDVNNNLVPNLMHINKEECSFLNYSNYFSKINSQRIQTEQAIFPHFQNGKFLERNE